MKNSWFVIGAVQFLICLSIGWYLADLPIRWYLGDISIPIAVLGMAIIGASGIVAVLCWGIAGYYEEYGQGDVKCQ